MESDDNLFTFPNGVKVFLSAATHYNIEYILNKNMVEIYKNFEKCVLWYRRLREDMCWLARGGYMTIQDRTAGELYVMELMSINGEVGYYLYRNLDNELFIHIEYFDFDLTLDGLEESKSRNDNLEQFAHMITESVMQKIRQLAE